MFTKISQTSFRASDSPGLDIIVDLLDGMVFGDSCSNSWELLLGSGWNILFILFFFLAFFIVDIVVLLAWWRRRLLMFILVYFLVFFILVCPTCGCLHINSWFTLS